MGLGLQADLGLQAAWLLNRAVAIFALLRCAFAFARLLQREQSASQGVTRLKKLALNHMWGKHL